MLILILLVVSISYAIWHYMWPKSATVPLHPGHQPIFGYVLNIYRSKDIWKFFQTAAKFSTENGGVTKMLMPFCTFYHITDVNAAATTLSQCLDKMFVYKTVNQIFGSILISAPVPIWKTTRHILEHSFKQNVLIGYLELFNLQAAKLAEMMKDEVDKGEVNLKEIIGLITLETAWQTTVEKSEKGNVDKNLLYCLQQQSRIWVERAKSFYLLPNITFNFTSLKKEQDKYKNVIERNIQKAIERSKATYYERKNNNKAYSFEETKHFSNLDIFLQNSVTERGFLYSDAKLNMLIANLLLATLDTTNNTLLFILACIGSDSQVQERAYHEIKTVVGDNDVTKEHLPKLVYLEAVIKEVIRLFPVGPIIGRQSSKDVKLKGITIPKGACFAIHLWAINRRKEYWGEDADKFRPERWLSSETLPKPAQAFASFSLGQRNCIGKTYSIYVIKTYLVHVLRKYRVSGDYTRIENEFVPLLEPTSGYHVTLSNR